MTIEAKIIEDSISDSGKRITTFLLKYPRFIHCFDEQTEVLCEIDGIKKYIPWSAAVDLKPKLAAYHANGDITFEYPAAWIKRLVDNEPMVFIENQRISMLVTEGHRLYVGSRKAKRNEWGVIQADEMLGEHTQKRFVSFGFYRGGENLGNMAKLLGFFVGDGSVTSKGGQVIFHLKKERKILYLKQLLADMNIPFDERTYTDGTTNIIFTQFRDLMESCYSNDGQKKIPKVVYDSDSSSFRSFLDGLWNSVGSADRGYLSVFNTSSFEVADGLCVLASMHGMRMNIKPPYGKDVANHKKMYKIINCTECTPIIRRDKHPAKRVNYSGYVYCASVSTGLLMVRRDGKVHVSGNCEFMTHRVFSRNASSSRAIPFKRAIKMIKDDMAMPLSFNQNKPGMQGGAELSPFRQRLAFMLWGLAGRFAILFSSLLNRLGAHKQYVNRLTEPFSHITVVCTATEYANFFALRLHPDAQPEIQALAKAMWTEYVKSTPIKLKIGEWHLPFVSEEERQTLPLDAQIKTSVARCARTSYNNFDGVVSKAEDDIRLYDKLVGTQPIHASPAEHQATPLLRAHIQSGNFFGWKQYRKTLENENITTLPEGLG